MESPATDPIHRRLESLGITLVKLTKESGRMRAAIRGSARWVEHLLIDCPAFQVTVDQAWQRICTAGPVELWPGIWLRSLLPASSRRRRQNDPLPDRGMAAIFVGTAFLQSEQFQLLCDFHRLDCEAAIQRIDVSALVSRREAERTAAMIEWMQSDTADSDRRGSEVQGLSVELSSTYEELSLLYKLAMNMTVDQPPRQFIADACGELQQVVGMRWLALQLVSDDPRLNDLQGEVFTAGDLVLSQEQVRTIGRHLMGIGLDPNRPKVIDDTSSLGLPELTRQSTDLLVVPLATDQRLMGVLFGGQKIDGVNLTTVDSKLCGALANSLSIFIENFMLYEDMQAMFLGTLHALTAAIDAKDSYTFGHSERVALMSRMLAQAAGLDSHEVERVYISGLIHDVGKIGVPEAVLCKPGKLTKAEFDQIRMHPEIGARILRDIRQMKDIIPGVLHHHERWDGKGYPYGISGLEIPIFGRVIALADSFDAMSSTRTYRAQLPHEQVISEIHRCAGTQFDPELAKVFVELDFEPYRAMHRRHELQHRDTSG